MKVQGLRGFWRSGGCWGDLGALWVVLGCFGFWVWGGFVCFRREVGGGGGGLGASGASGASGALVVFRGMSRLVF